ERVIDVLELQPRTRLLARDLDDDVEIARLVVGDGKADAAVVHARRDLHVGGRRLQQSRRMVVQQHLATTREAGERQHAAHVATRDDTRRDDGPLLIDRADEADLASAGKPDGSAHGAGRGVGDSGKGRGRLTRQALGRWAKEYRKIAPPTES